MRRIDIAGIIVVVLGVVLLVSVFAGQPKVTLCHKGNTLTVAQPAAAAHYAHGDTPGPCPASPAK
jgi:hypothetical protein